MEKAKVILEIIRGAVRPYLAYLFASAFVALAIVLILKFGSEDIAGRITDGFITTVGMVIAFYMGQRQNKPSR